MEVRIPIAILMAAAVAMTAVAADSSAIDGHYHYDQYVVTLPNGRTLGLKDLGATDATLDITASGTITLHMTMSSGKLVAQSAKIVSLQFSQGKGYWIAQWPDMSYPVRAEISIAGGVLTTDTRFEERSDPERFGSTEHAVLKKVSSP